MSESFNATDIDIPGIIKVRKCPTPHQSYISMKYQSIDFTCPNRRVYISTAGALIIRMNKMFIELETKLANVPLHVKYYKRHCDIRHGGT